MTSKERSELKTKAMKMESIFQIGKSSLTTQSVDAIKAALKARELVKINVLKNCDDDVNEIATVVAERTGSEVVQVIGRKIVLYKKNMQKEEKKRLAQKRQLKRKEAAKKKARDAKKAQKTWTKQDSMRQKKENMKKKDR